jgi:hypothetical protein
MTVSKFCYCFGTVRSIDNIVAFSEAISKIFENQH